jgi:hypothetical protein
MSNHEPSDPVERADKRREEIVDGDVTENADERLSSASTGAWMLHSSRKAKTIRSAGPTSQSTIIWTQTSNPILARRIHQASETRESRALPLRSYAQVQNFEYLLALPLIQGPQRRSWNPHGVERADNDGPVQGNKSRPPSCRTTASEPTKRPYASW